jgi:WD40 repeat protein
MTTRLYDTRNFGEPLAIFKSELSSVRCLRFSHDSSLLAMGESADYVHLVDLSQSFSIADEAIQGQSIDFFGEVSGLSWSLDDEFLFIGTADPIYGSILEFERTPRDKAFLDWETLYLLS